MKIHILDVIKFVNKRYIFGQQEKEENLLSTEKYQKELRLFDIKQKNVSKRLKEELKKYHKGYEIIVLERFDNKIKIDKNKTSPRKEKNSVMKQLKKMKSYKSFISKKPK